MRSKREIMKRIDDVEAKFIGLKEKADKGNYSEAKLFSEMAYGESMYLQALLWVIKEIDDTPASIRDEFPVR